MKSRGEREEWDDLIDACMDGSADEESWVRLEARLASSEEDRARYWERVTLEQGLESWGGQLQGVEKIEAPLAGIEPKGKAKRAMLAASGWAAAALVMAAWAWQAMSHDTTEVPVTRAVEHDSALPGGKEERAFPVAYLSRVVGVKSGERFMPGQSLALGQELVIEEGMLEVVFFSGARMTVKGPAKFTPLGDLSIQFDEGRAEVRVPDSALGFRMFLPDGEITDFGTQFDIEVSEGVTSRIQVVKGEIELNLKGQGKGPVRLSAGEARRIERDGGVASIDYSPSEMGEAIEALSKMRNRVKMSRWQKFNEGLQSDPSLVVHFRMQPGETGEKEIVNHARSAEAPGSGTIVSAEWTEGRWPMKPALAFRNQADQVRIDIPGEFPEASMLAWVRVDALPRNYNGVFFSECGIEGEAHWQFSSDGTYQFGVRPRNAPLVSVFHRAFTKPVISPWAFGSWRLLSTTYHSGTREVVHYIDAAEVSRTVLEDSIPLRFGRSTLGNFHDMHAEDHMNQSWLGAEWSFRNWTGAIDEFMLFSRVVSTRELEEIFEVGRND